MANASLYEPLSQRHGVGLWSAEVTYGTAVTPATSLGICTFNWVVRNGNQYLYGPGSRDFLAVVAGEVTTEFTITIPGVQAGHKTLLQRAFPTSGEIPSETFGFGYSDDQGTPNRSADQLKGARIGSLELGLDASGGLGPLTATISGESHAPTVVTTLAPATLTTTPFASWMGEFTLGGTAYDIRTWSTTVNNGLRRDFVIPGTAPSSNLRGPKFVSTGNRTIEGELSWYRRSPVDPLADCPTGSAMVLELTNPCDSSSLTFTYTDVVLGEVTTSEDENGIIWTTPFRAKTLALT